MGRRLAYPGLALTGPDPQDADCRPGLAPASTLSWPCWREGREGTGREGSYPILCPKESSIEKKKHQDVSGDRPQSKEELSIFLLKGTSFQLLEQGPAFLFCRRGCCPTMRPVPVASGHGGGSSSHLEEGTWYLLTPPLFTLGFKACCFCSGFCSGWEEASR